MKGKISSWDDEKGYGFIEPIGGGKRVFVHIKAFANRNHRPEINQIVTFTSSTDKHGRPCAANATRAGEIKAQKPEKPNSSISITVAVTFLTFVGTAVLMSKTSPAIFAVYLIASLITFIAYALDKAAARKGNWRTQESTLHALALIGGWPGALIAQQKLRHKSKKQSFRIVFWLTVLLNCGAFAWVISPSGSEFLNSTLKGYNNF
jgi:uncharacterized membrane protein YsdA (DUF1294 family)/cold shock CspA family protein